MVVKWSSRALNHASDIYRLYLEKNRTAAEKILNTIIEEGDKLGNFPKIAQKEQLLSEQGILYRSLVVKKNFKIIYSIYKDHVHIVDVWDCRRNPKTNINNINQP